MGFISYFFLPVSFLKIRSFDRSRYRQFKKPKFRKTEITTTRNPDNSNTRKLELSIYRFIDLSKKEKWENPTIRQHFPISYFSFFISYLPTSCDSRRIVLPVIWFNWKEVMIFLLNKLAFRASTLPNCG